MTETSPNQEKISTLRQLWEKTGGDNLLKGKTFQDIFNGAPAKQKELALNSPNQDLCCMDEGLEGSNRLGGGGILMGDIKSLTGKVSGIRSHEGCGAAKVYAETHNIETSDTDLVGDEQARLVAEQLSVPYNGRITKEEMSRPSGIHKARAHYVTTQKFDSSQIEALPPGFTTSRNLIGLDNGEYAKMEMELAFKIATDKEHGFGGSITSESPYFIVVVLGNQSDPLLTDQAVREAQDIAAHHPEIQVTTLHVG